MRRFGQDSKAARQQPHQKLAGREENRGEDRGRGHEPLLLQLRLPGYFFDESHVL